MHRRSSTLSFLLLLPCLAAQEPEVEQSKPKSQEITQARLLAAYADAQQACSKVLKVELELLPELKITDADEVARAIAAENLPSIKLREPDEEKAATQATLTGQQLGEVTMAKYSWSTRSFLVVAATWERTARVLRRPQLTSDHALRAVMVHELCHAIDDHKFDFAKRLLQADTVDAMNALNAVIEGHAQLLTRRVCAASGWSDGFEVYTSSIGALPPNLQADAASTLVLRAYAAAIASAYLDGERFVAAVLAARPENGSRDLFESPPLDAETILEPGWYLDAKTRPTLLYDVEPAIDAFVAGFDMKVWSAARSNITGQQLAVGMAMLPKEEVAAIVKSLRAARFVQCAPTADPNAKIALLIAMEFDSEAAASRWIAASAKISDIKDDTMDKGMVRIVGSKTTPLAREGLQGFLQEKQMKNGRLAFDVATIDAMRGRIVLETIYSGDPPTVEAHLALVEELLGKVVRRK